jgi:hypothetical protein
METSGSPPPSGSGTPPRSHTAAEDPETNSTTGKVTARTKEQNKIDVGPAEEQNKIDVGPADRSKEDSKLMQKHNQASAAKLWSLNSSTIRLDSCSGYSSLFWKILLFRSFQIIHQKVKKIPRLDFFQSLWANP